MKILEFLESGVLAEVKKETDEFCHQILASYNKEIKEFLDKKHDGHGPKDIHDAVWGTILLNAGEVLIIDSPLLQRLRKINHLGLAGLLFPGADYSRFEHTLGVLEVANKIGQKISTDDSLKRSGHLPSLQLVRLAAIFHDVGHLIASHASERYYESTSFSRAKLIHEIERAFHLKAGKVDIRLSEILSVLIVTSAPVIELLRIAWPLTEEKYPVTDAEFKNYAGYIAALILGIPINWDLLPYSSIIHGPVDADKCDYLARDSQHTGVPVAVDLYRVIQKLKLVRLSPKVLGELWEDTPESEMGMLLGIALSAVRSIEEIIVSRTLMFEKIYYHHKIVSVETMFRRALQLLDEAGLSLISNFSYALRLYDEDLLSGKAEILLPSIINSMSPGEKFDENKVRKACSLLNRISQRRLNKRACAVSLGFLKSLSNSDPVKIIRDLFEIPSPYILEDFLGLVRQETKNILTLMGNTERSFDNFDNDILTVNIPEVITSDLNMPVEIGGGVKFYRDFFQGELWDNSRKINTTCHYVISAPEIRYEVYLATEMVLYKKYRVILEDFSYLLCKLDPLKLLKIRESLALKGYYKNHTDIIPDCLVVKAADYKRIAQIERKCRGYQGPKHDSILLDKACILRYLRQFYYLNENIDEIIDGVLRILDGVLIISRKEISDSLTTFLRSLKEKRGLDYNSLKIAPLGGLRDSSHHISYYINDVDKNLNSNIIVEDISTFLQEELGAAESLVFIDDAFWSGKQIICIFQELLGVKIEDRVLHESHCRQLEPAQIARLKEAKGSIFCIYGNSASCDYIGIELKRLGLNFDVRYEKSFPEKLFAQEGVFRTDGQKELIRELFKSIGRQLLKSSKCKGGTFQRGWDEVKTQEFSLGYNDAQQTIVLGWNTPSYTITALWANGELDDGTTWIPLFPRLSKT